MPKMGARTRIFVLALMTFSMVGLAPYAASAAPASQGRTSVSVSPSQGTVGCDSPTAMQVEINDVEDLFGVDIKISFDANALSIVDVNGDAIDQVGSGDLPDLANNHGFLSQNKVDAEAGIITYAAIRLNPHGPQSGSGVAFSFHVQGKAAGSSALTLESVLLSDENAGPIAADLANAQVTVNCDDDGGDGGDGGGTDPTPAPTSDPGSGGDNGGGDQGGGDNGGDHGHGNGKVPGCYHYVTAGDTLYSIAYHYGVSVASLASHNGIYNHDYIYTGQKLSIPGCGKGGYDGKPGKPTHGGGYGKPVSGGCHTYRVSAGDTLFGIAWRYGDSVAGLAKRNGILNPEWVWAGQSLTVCGNSHYGKPGYDGGYKKPAPAKPGHGKPGYGACRYTHVVQYGDTVFNIGWRYGSSSYAISSASGLANPHLIYVGQTLCIP